MKNALAKKYKSNKPFPHFRIKGLFEESLLDAVRKALLAEKFHEQEANLFSFQQTNDLKLSKNRVLKGFREHLRTTEFVNLLEQLTGEKLSRKIDISGFIYDDTDHLLPHDDKLEGRKIAFVINLSKKWKAKYGGQLDFFKGKKIAKSLVPEWNSFVIFTVKPGKTFHQVREVLVDKKRLSLAGWYHAR